MTASVDRQGNLVLNVESKEKLDLRPGDVLVVDRSGGGQFILKRRSGARVRSRRDYLNPPPLAAGVLAGIYSNPDSDWDKVESEAALTGRRSLAGNRLEDL